MTAGFKIILIGLLLDLHIKEDLDQCAKVCDKSVVILLRFQGGSFYGPMVRYKNLLASLRKCIEGPTQLRSYRDIRYSSSFQQDGTVQFFGTKGQRDKLKIMPPDGTGF